MVVQQQEEMEVLVMYYERVNIADEKNFTYEAPIFFFYLMIETDYKLKLKLNELLKNSYEY